jgi:hypothetical protein
LKTTDIKAVIESIFRIRTNTGELIDYQVVPSHEKLLKTGLLGDKSKLSRIINKGRQGGFSYFFNIECLMIAQLLPNTNQFYVATREEQAKKWIKNSESLARDARVFPNSDKIIDMDFMKSTQLTKYIRHFPKEFKKTIEYSYIVGLPASPSGIRGGTGINIILDEYAQMTLQKDLQIELYNAIKYFISQGGQMTISTTPLVKSDEFWNMYTNAENYLLSPFYFPIIENWETIDLHKDLRKQKLDIPYFWTSIEELEKARRKDLDFFKQEALGIPADVMLRYMTPELVYSRVDSTEKFTNDNNGIYIFGIDVGQVRDTTAVTVGELINGEIFERWVQDSQSTYPEQTKEIVELCKRYKPIEIRIDHTGVGIPITQMLEVIHGMPPIMKVDFASYIEEDKSKRKIPTFLMEEFKKSLVDRKYHLLNNPLALNHVLRIEKLETLGKTIKFTGKRGGGRDDHAWSKALLNAPFERMYKNMPVGIGTKNTTTTGRLTRVKEENQRSLFPRKDKGYAMWG